MSIKSTSNRGEIEREKLKYNRTSLQQLLELHNELTVMVVIDGQIPVKRGAKMKLNGDLLKIIMPQKIYEVDVTTCDFDFSSEEEKEFLVSITPKGHEIIEFHVYKSGNCGRYCQKNGDEYRTEELRGQQVSRSFNLAVMPVVSWGTWMIDVLCPPRL